MEISTFVGKLCINIQEKRGPFFMTFSPSLLTFSSHLPLTPQKGESRPHRYWKTGRNFINIEKSLKKLTKPRSQREPSSNQ